MNILMLAPHPFYADRGTPIAVRQLLETLSQQGHTIDVLTYHVGEDISIAGVTIHRIGKPLLINDVPIGPSIRKAVCDLWMLFKTLSLASRRRYDLVHAVEESAFIAELLRCRWGLPYVYDMDSLLSLQMREKSALLWPAAKLFAWLEKRSIRRSVGVLAVCPALVDQAMKHHPKHLVELLPDVPMADRTDAEPGALPETLTEAPGVRVMYVGNLQSYQGVGLLLEAFGQIAGDCPDATLLIVGGTPADIAAHRQRVQSLSDQGRIRFVGAIPLAHLGAVLHQADILVSPRKQGNNTPMKIYSYLQSGRPVLATRLETHTQVLNDETSLLVEPTAAAMAAGLKRLIHEPERRDRLGSAGRRHLETHYSAQAFAQRLKRFYGRVEEELAANTAPTARATESGSSAR